MAKPLVLPSLAKHKAPALLPHVQIYKYIDTHKAFERVFAGKHVGSGPETPLNQVSSFILLGNLHAYIAQARRELALSLGLGTAMCEEHCYALRRTPLVSQLEAEYIISRTGYYSELVQIAERWLLQQHAEAPTYPDDLPGALMERPTALSALPQIGRELRALLHLRSPFLLTERDVVRDRLLSGPWMKTSYADGTAQVHAQNWDLLEETQPLVCAVSGVFTVPPSHCTRRMGLGESDGMRIVADPTTLQRYHKQLLRLYERMPEKGQYGLLPAMIMRAARPVQFQQYAQAGKIALAKLSLGVKGPFPYPLWEGQYAGYATGKIVSSRAGFSGGTRGAAPAVLV